MEAESGAGAVGSESRAGAQKDESAAGEGVAAQINTGTVGARLGNGAADGEAERVDEKARSKKTWRKVKKEAKKERERYAVYKRAVDPIGVAEAHMGAAVFAETFEWASTKPEPTAPRKMHEMMEAASLLAAERKSEARRSGREADQVRHDWNGGAEVVLPNVDRSEPVADMAQVCVRDSMDLQATLPEREGGEGGRYLMATREAPAMPTVWPTVRPTAGCRRLR